MVISTDYKFAFIHGLKWDSNENGQTLFNELKSVTRARLTATAAGNILVGSLANGHSAQWILPNNGQGMTPDDKVSLCAQVMRLYSRAIANLGGTPNDDQIFTEMIGLLPEGGVVSSTNDYTQLRTAGA